MNSANLAAQARTIQAGQIRNGLPVHSVNHWNGTGNVRANNVGRAGNQFAHAANARGVNSANLAAHARTIQAGQVRNGLAVHSVNHWNGTAHANANQQWHGNWNHHGNHHHDGHHHHHGNFFAFGFFPWFWGWPGGFFWPWWGFDGGWGGDYGYWNYPPYYSDSWVTPSAYLDVPQQTVPTTSANLEVFVPDPNAQVQLDGHQTSATGSVRYFASPPLPPGDYTYHVTATWIENGKPVSAELNVGVQPGKVTVVDFTQPQGQPGAQELPSAPLNPGP